MSSARTLGVAAEQDVRTTAGHVRGDGDRANASGLRHNVRLALMVLRVQGLMRNAALIQQAGEPLELSMETVPIRHGWPAA